MAKRIIFLSLVFVAFLLLIVTDDQLAKCDGDMVFEDYRNNEGSVGGVGDEELNASSASSNNHAKSINNINKAKKQLFDLLPIKRLNSFFEHFQSKLSSPEQQKSLYEKLLTLCFDTQNLVKSSTYVSAKQINTFLDKHLQILSKEFTDLDIQGYLLSRDDVQTTDDEDDDATEFVLEQNSSDNDMLKSSDWNKAKEDSKYGREAVEEMLQNRDKNPYKEYQTISDNLDYDEKEIAYKEDKNAYLYSKADQDLVSDSHQNEYEDAVLEKHDSEFRIPKQRKLYY